MKLPSETGNEFQCLDSTLIVKEDKSCQISRRPETWIDLSELCKLSSDDEEVDAISLEAPHAHTVIEDLILSRTADATTSQESESAMKEMSKSKKLARPQSSKLV